MEREKRKEKENRPRCFQEHGTVKKKKKNIKRKTLKRPHPIFWKLLLSSASHSHLHLIQKCEPSTFNRASIGYFFFFLLDYNDSQSGFLPPHRAPLPPCIPSFHHAPFTTIIPDFASISSFITPASFLLSYGWMSSQGLRGVLDVKSIAHMWANIVNKEIQLLQGPHAQHTGSPRARFL